MMGNDRLNSLKREAEALMGKLTTEAERLARMGSLKLKISTLRGEIRDYQSEVGAWACRHRDQLPDDASLLALLGKIDALEAEVTEFRGQLGKLNAHAEPCANDEGSDGSET